MKTRLNNIFFILVTLIIGMIILSPHLDYQTRLSQGDHGRDLYSFYATLKGKTPYQDYWWVYGPVIPYFYGGLFKIFGITIKTVLFGQWALSILAGVFFYLILRLYVPVKFAVLSALWFWTFKQYFFFTYNHASGILMLLITTYLILLYIQKNRIRCLYISLIAVLLLSLIKINFGLIALGVLVMSVFTADKMNKEKLSNEKKTFYLVSLIGLPALIACVYYFFLRNLPVHVIRQCFPYLGVDHPHTASIWNILSMWWNAIAVNINMSWTNRAFAFILIACIAKTFWELKDLKTSSRQQKNILLTIGILFTFYVLNLHEFLASGVLYRSNWSQPFSILMIFLFIGYGMKSFSGLIQSLLFTTLLFIVILSFIRTSDLVQLAKNPHQFLDLKRGQIYVGNDPDWVQTVTKTTRYLEQNLKQDETFFALPYDPIYYYLTDQLAPTRQLIFFDHINIPEQQERKIIQDLENKRVNYVVLSNRHNSTEKGNGVLGKTYCLMLDNYLKKNFEEIKTFGNWQDPPQWVTNHGTRILKRKK